MWLKARHSPHNHATLFFAFGGRALIGSDHPCSSISKDRTAPGGIFPVPIACANSVITTMANPSISGMWPREFGSNEGREGGGGGGGGALGPLCFYHTNTLPRGLSGHHPLFITILTLCSYDPTNTGGQARLPTTSPRSSRLSLPRPLSTRPRSSSAHP